MGVLLFFFALAKFFSSQAARAVTDLIARNVHGLLDVALTARFKQALSAAGIPYGFAMGWGSVEASGHMGRVDKTISAWAAAGGERGWFQVSPDESTDRGFSHLRIATDDDYTIDTGIALVLGYYHQAVAGGAPAGSKLAWGIAKFMHAIGSGTAKKILAASSPADLASWEAWKAHASTFGGAARHWIANVDHVFAEGEKYGPLENAPAELVAGSDGTDDGSGGVPA